MPNRSHRDHRSFRASAPHAIVRRRRRWAAIEPLETRRLMAVTFDFTIVDPGNAHLAFHDEILAVMNAAGETWSDIFDSNASIEVLVDFMSDNSNILAVGGIDQLEVIGQENGVDIGEMPAATEIRTESDANSTNPDGLITWNDVFFSDEHFDPNTAVPNDKIDAYSIALHELGHVLGFAAIRNNFTGAIEGGMQTPFDQNIQFIGGLPYFVGPAATFEYGDDVPLAIGSISHYGNIGGPGVDLVDDLMGTTADLGVRYEISDLDRAILWDIDLPVIGVVVPPPPPTPPAQGTFIVAGTAIKDTIIVISTGSRFAVTINGDRIGPNGIVEQDEEVDPSDLFFDASLYDGVLIDGGRGNDTITLIGAFVNATILGSSGNDTIKGSAGSETISGGAGSDVLFGGAGRDRLDGAGGNDNIYGGEGEDRLFGGAGHDYLDGGEAFDRLFGGEGNDFVFGAAGNDRLYGEGGNDVLRGGHGRDNLDGGIGADTFDGGGGEDIATYNQRTDDLIISLNGLADDGAVGEGDNVLSIENVYGGMGNDRIAGDGFDNALVGGPGNDTIDGGSGNDLIHGGAGSDKLQGSSGNDTLEGQGGNDLLFGGGGFDELHGGRGNDRLFSFDRWADLLDGGAGDDSAETDGRDESDLVENLTISL